MKTLKYIFLLILIALVIGSVYLATLDGTYDVNRSRIIKAQPEVIFNDLNNYKNWKDWGPWYEEDPSIEVVFGENTIGEGGSYKWTGKEGDGSMQTLKVDKPKSIEQEIIFKTPFGDMKSDVYWILEKVETGTNLTWGMKGEMGFFTRWMADDMEEQIGPMEERGLELFDKNLMEKIKVFSIETNGVVDFSGGYYLYLTSSSKIEQLGNKYQKLKITMESFIKNNNIRTTGVPFSLYHKFDTINGTSMFSVGIPVAEKIATPIDTDVISGFMNSGKYFKTTLKGSYENSPKAWKTAIMEAGNLDEYKVIEMGEPFELFLNDLKSTPNPADLVSEIYIPVEKIDNFEE
jgi:effector-binding domain-containing protein